MFDHTGDPESSVNDPLIRAKVNKPRVQRILGDLTAAGECGHAQCNQRHLFKHYYLSLHGSVEGLPNRIRDNGERFARKNVY